MSDKDYDEGLEAAAKFCDRRMDTYLDRADEEPRTSINFTVYSGVATQARIVAAAIRKLKSVPEHENLGEENGYNVQQS